MINNQKIIHKRFQKNYSEGAIEVQLNFVIEENLIEITNMQIHGTFDSGLPNSPKIEQINNKVFLVSQYINIDGKIVLTRIVGNNYADDILEEILKLKKEISEN
ncbi:hypothetical protein KIH23_10085 [Flavobacterium sp. CYK-55]|uniref:hypothetical protein n=1 Tax=Flavobacterium sp. CYK-55 TaxID=2835529 RepID=UPI001BCB59C6|nr:hypothetical protein [Flavobacterium sp. CYK-55]MBS7787646.1 hypothetical protein [Flavobacterium sp. CYK-55]